MERNAEINGQQQSVKILKNLFSQKMKTSSLAIEKLCFRGLHLYCGLYT